MQEIFEGKHFPKLDAEKKLYIRSPFSYCVRINKFIAHPVDTIDR